MAHRFVRSRARKNSELGTTYEKLKKVPARISTYTIGLLQSQKADFLERQIYCKTLVVFKSEALADEEEQLDGVKEHALDVEVMYFKYIETSDGGENNNSSGMQDSNTKVINDIHVDKLSNGIVSDLAVKSKKKKKKSRSESLSVGAKESDKGDSKKSKKEKVLIPEEASTESRDIKENVQDLNGTPFATGKITKKQRIGSTEPKTANAFRRVEIETVEIVDDMLKDNSYRAKHCTNVDYEAKAQEVLGQVRGEYFRLEKTKKIRESYRGGIINLGSHSIKYDNSVDGFEKNVAEALLIHDVVFNCGHGFCWNCVKNAHRPEDFDTTEIRTVVTESKDQQIGTVTTPVDMMVQPI
ncbi:hypothetical protein MKW94_024319 [Papaver nudicaule]|uniref:Srp40 C-terminal domain-containing protein n=1 Tax=Papaver nudicaule TaxID=74823 RepID=A0AA41RZZ7_PAPNU|nr:hypothetical protein [Papaver nudicaule]